MATNLSNHPERFRTAVAGRQPVYLDYAATTPVDERVAQKMMHCLTLHGVFANPASTSHQMGRDAKGLVELARVQVANLVNARPSEIIWTSGATESDNLAIKGAAHLGAHRNRRHIVTCKTEHKAVLDTCKQLELEGFDVTYLVPGQSGAISLSQVQSAVRDDTSVVSIMHVNNEIGVVQDIAAIGEFCRSRGITFHVDAAQSAGKLPIDLQALSVCLMSFSAHKVYGPKGIGALYVCSSPRTLIEPIIHGGGHEKGMRSGTLATHQIVGMGEAFDIARQQLQSDHDHIERLRERLLTGLREVGGVHCNGCQTRRVAGILNVSFEGVEGESLLFALRELAVSSGSACTSASAEASYVLRALGRPDQLAQSSIRFSLGRFSTEPDVDYAIQVVKREVPRLRALGQQTL
ncbi:MAG: IscS subfamily cysteine desulfurase [Gammaproteobacteria bacterium]|nr:IscS subfamily cysteine desulfurase [Gammaproteobacteria bacterium]